MADLYDLEEWGDAFWWQQPEGRDGGPYDGMRPDLSDPATRFLALAQLARRLGDRLPGDGPLWFHRHGGDWWLDRWQGDADEWTGGRSSHWTATPTTRLKPSTARCGLRLRRAEPEPPPESVQQRACLHPRLASLQR